MFFGKKKKESRYKDIDHASEMIDQTIEELEQMINRRATKTMRTNRNTLPPLDRVATTTRKKQLKVALDQGSVRNRRRETTVNTFLLLLLVACIIASACWVMKLLGIA